MTGSEFRAIRKRMRISQKTLAKIMGTFQSTISRWESLESVPPIPAAFMHVLDVGDKFFSVPKVLCPGQGLLSVRRKNHTKDEKYCSKQ